VRERWKKNSLFIIAAKFRIDRGAHFKRRLNVKKCLRSNQLCKTYVPIPAQEKQTREWQ
jgi:hypothetical protein